MKQKELTQAIREGINESRNDFCNEIFKAIIWGFVFFIVGLLVVTLIIMPLWNKYDNYRCEKNPDKCVLPGASIQASCRNNEVNLYCQIIRNHNETITSESICGYQEANAWFEQLKKQVEGDLHLECD